MDVIQKFIKQYRRELDFYQEVARLVASQCERELQSAGIRAIVTYRAKRSDRLEEKLRQRIGQKHYKSVDSIYKDIIDLAGIRIALYFPADREEVGKIIQRQFVVTGKIKEFPDGSPPKYAKKFDGYHATHYRVQLKEANLLDSQKRYMETQVEIQVASVLMHAWAEVEHDLVYKPLNGQLSVDEYAILDELNGLVLSGEIGLERLQRAMEQRVGRGESRFTNHFELAAFLYEAAKDILSSPEEPVMGRVDLLFRLLVRAELNTPDALKPYLASLHANTEVRPLAEQMTDQILVASPEMYQLYSEVRAEGKSEDGHHSYELKKKHEEWDQALAKFMKNWIRLERLGKRLAYHYGISNEMHGVLPKAVAKLPVFEATDALEIERIRVIRNNLVHGVELPSTNILTEASSILKAILDKAVQKVPEEIKDETVEILKNI